MGSEMQRLEGLMRKACAEYGLIEEGDVICVGVSGGKDSVALAFALQRMRRYYSVPYEVKAVTLDPGFLAQPIDYTPLTRALEAAGVPHLIKRTDIGHVVFEARAEPNPCSLCAKMRRGILHDAAKELGCNKIALGHHLDDAVETFYMNLWGEGRIGCFSSKSYLSRKDLTLIRPMVFAEEAQVAAAAASLGIAAISSGCPVDGTTRREEMKRYVTEACAKDAAFRKKMLGALKKSHIDGW